MKYLTLFVLLFAGCHAEKPAPYRDVTSSYQLPPELEGHKIIVLGGGWTATNPLWVVVPPTGMNQPLIIQRNK